VQQLWPILRRISDCPIVTFSPSCTAVAGQGDRKLHAFRAALLDELESPFGDVDGSAAVCDRRQTQATARTAAETRPVQSPTIPTCSPRHFTWSGDPSTLGIASRPTFLLAGSPIANATTR